MTQGNSFQATKMVLTFSWLYHNFFLPVMHLKQKQVTSQHTLLRIHDQALTPLDRLIKSGIISKLREAELLVTRNAINPLVLRSQIDILISQLLALPCLKPGEMVDFYQTKHNLQNPSITFSFEPTTQIKAKKKSKVSR